MKMTVTDRKTGKQRLPRNDVERALLEGIRRRTPEVKMNEWIGLEGLQRTVGADNAVEIIRDPEVEIEVIGAEKTKKD